MIPAEDFSDQVVTDLLIRLVSLNDVTNHLTELREAFRGEFFAGDQTLIDYYSQYIEWETGDEV
jgi:hypothetical protein